MNRILAIVLLVYTFLPAIAHAKATFKITVDKAVHPAPVTVPCVVGVLDCRVCAV